MRSEVRVLLADDQEFSFHPEGAPAMSPDTARGWLDAQFVQLGCAPLRPTGKVLLADKVLVVAQSAGPSLLGDSAWGADFARAVTAALGKPVVRIQVPAMTVSY